MPEIVSDWRQDASLPKIGVSVLDVLLPLGLPRNNFIMISGESGNTDVWLNGSPCIVNDASAWSVKYPTTLYVGAAFIANGLFDGVIHEVSFCKGLWTQEDVDADYDNALFNFQNITVPI